MKVALIEIRHTTTHKHKHDIEYENAHTMDERAETKTLIHSQVNKSIDR